MKNLFCVSLLFLCFHLADAQNKKELIVTVDSLKLVVSVLNNNIEKQQGQIMEEKTKGKKLEDRVASLTDKAAVLSSEIDDCKAEATELKKVVSKLKADLTSSSESCDSIQAFVKEYFSNSKKNVGSYVPETPEQFENFSGNWHLTGNLYEFYNNDGNFIKVIDKGSLWGTQNKSGENKNEFLPMVITDINVIDDELAEITLAGGEVFKCFYEFQYRFKYLMAYYLKLNKGDEFDRLLSLQITDEGIIVSYPLQYDVMGQRYFLGYMDLVE